MKKILCWCDGPSPIAFTGFGVVSKHVLNALHNTGKYTLNQLGINYHGQFYDKALCPWLLSPARLMDPNDPYGTGMFLNSIAEGDYDYVWIMNDTFVVHKAALALKEILDKKRAANQKVPKIVYYFPVDCCVRPDVVGMVELSDIPVAYTNFGREETLKVLPNLKDKIRIIPHGTDPATYFPYSKEDIVKLKRDYFQIPASDYLVINVNRNSARKQLTRTMVCFKEFQRRIHNSHLYIHAVTLDNGIDLLNTARELGLEVNKDVFFPPNYDPIHGYKDEVLNHLYNAGDVFLTNHLGEGFGISIIEAMSAGTPVIVPDNTVMPEIVGHERGFMYRAEELIYVDGSGLRKMGTTKEIVGKMLEVYGKGFKHTLPQVVAARKWAEINTWDSVCQQWIKLFDELDQGGGSVSGQVDLGELI
jgi:glycosyltransferase involved in cell wall biosynthesis